MNRVLKIVSGIWVMTSVGGCCGFAPPPEKPVAIVQPKQEQVAPNIDVKQEESHMIIDPPIWNSKEEVEAACKAGLEKAEKKRLEVLGVKDVQHTLENTLNPVNDLLIEVTSLLSMSELMANVHPNETVRDASEMCQQDAMKFISAFELDRGVYDALTAVDVANLDPKAQRFVKFLLRDYRLAGVDKDDATRAKLTALKDEMVKAGQDFDRAIRDDQRSITITKKETAGLPEELLKPRLQEDGTYKFTTDGPDFTPVAEYAADEAVRKRMFEAYLQRAYPINDTNLKNLLALRREYANILGYPNWAAYNAVDMMANSEQIVADFIDKVANIARPRMKSDIADLLKRKKKDYKKADAIHEWDRFYYINQVKTERFGVDPKVLRTYFEYNNVIKGILDVNAEMFGVTFEKAPSTPVWNEDVEAYNVMESGTLVGRFYLDMHPREGKYGHAAEFGMLTGITGRQIPSASLVCNFAKPTADTPALLEHDQVTTIFHEFGHLMHQILAGRHPWVTLSGIACEGDFVEAPSQLLEHWAWEYEILSRFAKHYQTGEVIPKDLVEKMKAADEFGRGAHVMRQMYYAGLSLAYHTTDPKNIDLLGVVKEMQKKYSPYPLEKDTYVYASFGHLEGYSSAYYTYMWSLSLSEDLYTKFEKEGLMNHSTDRAYREAVIDPGGTVDAVDMVKHFLGRAASFDALENYLRMSTSDAETKHPAKENRKK
jgi:thimet oligopeptidase